MTQDARWGAIVVLGLAVGCGGGARDEPIDTFGAVSDDGSGGDDGADGNADDGDDGNADDGANDDGGSEDDGGSDGADDGDTGGPGFSCDVVVACNDGAPVAGAGVTTQIPIGCGAGAFTAAQSIDVANFADPEAPRSMPLLGDLDDDGDLDLVLNFRKASVGLVFPGTGTGTVELTPGALSGGLFAGGWGGDLGDFSGDGRLDVLFGDHVRSARAWVSSGGLAFAESRVGLPDDPLFSGAGLADLDGNGTLDALFGADQFTSGLHFYAGDGAGSWSAATGPVLAESNLGHFAFNDYDDDGDLDVFAFGKAGPGVTAFVLRNDGAGAFATVAQVSGGASPLLADPVQGSVGDVDCDGDLDIAAGGTVHLGDGAGSWTMGALVDASQVSHLADMNGDGHLDLVTHDPSVGLALYLGDGTGTSWIRDMEAGLPGTDGAAHGTPLADAYGIDIGDLDGNDALDIVRVGGFGATYFVDLYVR